MNLIICTEINGSQWELTKVSILANFINCEDIIKAVFIAFMPNNAHIDIVFPWKWCYFVCWDRSTSYSFLNSKL